MSPVTDELSALRIERQPMRPDGGRWVKWLVLSLLIGGAGVGSLAVGDPRAARLKWRSRRVTQRAAGTQASVLNASGYVTARRRATVSSKITGKVIEVNVDEGMAVRQGQVLARLDDSTPRAALALAQSQVRRREKCAP